MPTLGKKKVGKTMFLPTYLQEEALWHRVPHQMNSVYQAIFSGGVPIAARVANFHPAANKGWHCFHLLENVGV